MTISLFEELDPETKLEAHNFFINKMLIYFLF